MTATVLQPLNPIDATCLTGDTAGGPFWCETHQTEHTPDTAGVYVGDSGMRTDPYTVHCTAHSLHHHVKSALHARNLVAKHLREQHPGVILQPEHPDLNLTAAAEWLLVIRADPTVSNGPTWTAALALWEQLTGLRDDAAVRYALHVRDTPTRAAVVPF